MSASLDAIRILTDTANLTNAAQALGIPRGSAAKPGRMEVYISKVPVVTTPKPFWLSFTRAVQLDVLRAPS